MRGNIKNLETLFIQLKQSLNNIESNEVAIALQQVSLFLNTVISHQNYAIVYLSTLLKKNPSQLSSLLNICVTAQTVKN